MVTEKRTKLRKSRYIAAFIITLLVFALGWLLGMMMDSQRIDYLSEESNNQRIEYNSLQLQYQLIDEITKEKDCGAVLKTFEDSVKNLESARIRLETYQLDATINEKSFALLTREYSIAQIRYYLLAKKTQELCKNEVVTVLYFYSTREECPNCEEQAFVLTYLKKLIDQEILIFSFNSKLAVDEPTIGIMMNLYNVSAYPTVIINDKKYDYVLTKEKALKEICPLYEEKYDFCDGY